MLKLQGLVPIANTEKLIAQRQTASELDRLKEKAVKIVTENLKDFDMSNKEVFADLYGYDRFEGVEGVIMKVSNAKELDEIMIKVAHSALSQLGAIYSKIEHRLWAGHYCDFRYDYYDSPTLRKQVLITNAMGNFGDEFNTDTVFKDIPLLIEKSKGLARKLKEEGIEFTKVQEPSLKQQVH